MKRSRSRLSALALLGAFPLIASCRPDAAPRDPTPPAFRGEILQRFDFESGEAGPWSVFKLPGPGALTIAAEEAPNGNRFARFRLRRSDPIVSDGHRAELQLDAIGLAGEPATRWYGFRTRLPSAWEPDREYEVVAQWKGVDDKPQEESKSPCLALRVREREWFLTNRWDERRITPSNESPNAELWSGDLDLGRWTEWTVQVRWSYRADGLLCIWKDGALLVEKRGPNTFDDPGGIYFKLGIYKPPWDLRPERSRVDERIVEHDDVWFGIER